MSNDFIGSIAEESYISLETYRKNGNPVATPVWFVEDEGLIYVRTLLKSGKVKRIECKPQVGVAASEMDGKVKGKYYIGQASIADDQKTEMIQELLTQKYGFRKRVFDLLGRLRRNIWTIIVIHLD